MSALEKNWLEWLVFGLSLSIVLAVAGLLTWDALSSGRRPPRLSAEITRITRQGDTLEATVRVSNTGDRAAEQVRVEVQIGGAGGAVERGSFQIDLLPGGASHSGAVIFHGAGPGEPRAAAKVIGYSLP